MTTDPSPYAGTSAVSSPTDDEAITVVDGQTFCISNSIGNISPHAAEGLFVLDTRVLSTWRLLLNGVELERLAAGNDSPFEGVFLGRGRPAEGQADADLVVFRRRHVGNGMRERITVENHGLATRRAVVELACDVDFADLFEVKDGRVRRRGHHRYETSESAMSFIHLGPVKKQVEISFSGDVEVAGDAARWDLELESGASFEICIEVTVRVGESDLQAVFTCSGDDETAVPIQRMLRWRAKLPTVSSDDAAFDACLRTSSDDIGSLRIFDPDHPDVPILAAGAPWFMTVFGRDSLITAWMTLPADPSLAHGVLDTLARFQGERVDPESEEEPGKILHEMRFGAATNMSLVGGDNYYGSIDATPLFVMLLGELHQWDAGDEVVARLLPNVDRALSWIHDYGDRDGDGYVEYERSTENGLVNQGWKDSWDAIRFASGELAGTPIALCEVQGYVYAAYRARARIAEQFGDTATEHHYESLAVELRRRFNEDFWMEDEGFFALGLDGDKRQIDALASNVGHCLWTGIVDPDKAELVADRLLSDEFFSGWGIRTLATSMSAYNPVSYHNGSIWPHDNAICAAGLARYGFTAHASRLIRGQIRTASVHGNRLPELFAGFDKERLSIPASYPTSCSPQAWAAASPLLWLRTMLGFEACAPENRFWVQPHLPMGMNRLSLEGLRLSDRDVGISVTGDGLEFLGDVEGLDIVESLRPTQ